MKLRSGGVSVEYDKEVFGHLKYIFNCDEKRDKSNYTHRCKAVIETGTYLGTGTTRMVIDAVKASEQWKTKEKVEFITIEANEVNAKKAKKNIGLDTSWVLVQHGLSLYKKEIVEFIKSDKALLEHEKYPDLYIDCLDPVPFYLSEIEGKLPAFGVGKEGKDGLLYKAIKAFKAKRPLFILDSAGGMGYLEYMTVIESMKGRIFWVWIDDINHVKHFRSYEHMKNSDFCRIVVENERCAIGKFKGAVGPNKKARFREGIRTPTGDKTLKGACEEMGLDYEMVKKRCERGWTLKEAMEIPKGMKREDWALRERI